MVTASLFLLRHHPEGPVGARDHDVIGFDKTLREADRAAGFDHVRLDREPLPDLGAADEIDGHADRHQRIGAAHFVAAAVPMALSVSAAITPPWTNPRALVWGVASRSPRMIASGVF